MPAPPRRLADRRLRTQRPAAVAAQTPQNATCAQIPPSTTRRSHPITPTQHREAHLTRTLDAVWTRTLGWITPYWTLYDDRSAQPLCILTPDRRLAVADHLAQLVGAAKSFACLSQRCTPQALEQDLEQAMTPYLQASANSKALPHDRPDALRRLVLAHDALLGHLTCLTIPTSQAPYLDTAARRRLDDLAHALGEPGAYTYWGPDPERSSP